MADWTPPEAANAWTPPEAKGDTQAIASAPPATPAWHPPEAQQDTVQKLISDPKFDPAQYDIQTGDKETAFRAREALRNRSLGDKAAAVGQTLTEPATYGNAAMGALKFGFGAVAAPLHGLAQQVATIGAPIAGAVGADNLQRTLENEQQTEGAESTLAGQRVEEGLRATGRAVQNFSQDHPVLASVANPLLGVLPQPAPATEQDQRARFDAEIQAAKNAQQLQQQQPLNTGAVATAAKLATGTQNLQDVYSPNALAIQGARPANPFLTESMAAAGDPTNLAIPLAGEIPGVKNIAGGLVQAGGKLLQVPESIMGLVPKVAKLAKIGEGTATASTLGAVGYSALNHPAALASAGSAYLLGKTLGFAGRALEEQGGALRSGIPSALDQSAQSALSAGQSALGTNIQRGIGNAANNIVSTALGFAPVNAVLADGDPRKFAQSEVGAGVMGGVFGLAGDRARMEATANYRLAKYGAQQFTENPMWQAHQDAMSKFSPQDQQAINALRGTLYGGTGTDVLVLDGQNFAKQVGQIGGNARGQFAADPNGSTIYLNADAIGKTPSQKAGATLDAAGHETGHAVVDFLKNAGREGDAQNLFQSISSNLEPEQVQAMTDAYHGKLLASTDLTGKSPQEIDGIRQKIATDNPPEKILEENLAEITRRLLTGKNIGSYALPKPALQSVMDAASRFMESRGWMPAVDPNASLNFKAQMVREAVRRMNDVLYETGKTASAKANEGPTATQQLIDAKTRLAALPEITPDMPMSKARAIARQRDQAQKDLNEVQGMLNPEQEQPTGTPTTPAQPESLKLNRFRIAAILRQQGLSQSEAKQWADAANGSTDEEAVVDALKQRANQKFPSTPASQPVPQPVAKPQPIAQPIQTNERPVPTSQEKQSVAAVNASDVPGAGASAQTATTPTNEVAPNVSDRTTAPVRTKEEVDQIVNDAEKTATESEKNTKTKAAQDRIRKAKIEAVLSTIDPQEGGLHKETDQFGNETIVGDYDPTDPRHEALGKIAGLSKDAAQKLQETQDAKGKPLYIRYRSALSGQENAGETETGMINRKAEYEADPAKDRTEGTVQHKVIIPVGTEMTVGGKIVSKFITLDNLFHNVASIFEGLKGIGKDNPYGSTREAQGPLLTRDAQAYAENHANGYKGDGSGPMQGFPDSNLPKVNPDYQPKEIPADRFAILNMAFHSEAAGRLSDLMARQEKYAAEGKEMPKSIKAQLAKAQEAYALGAENNQWVDHQSGETNQLRAELKANGFDTKDRLKSPFETLSPQHILETSESPLPKQEGDLDTVRPHGFEADPAALAEKGLPQSKAVASGFLPNSGTPEEDPIESPAGQERSESPQGGLSQPGASTEDTGKPEDGETPSERLMREAEQAGVSVSLDTMKGMMRNDAKAMAKVRMMIRDRTGKDARFMPTDTAKDDMMNQAQWMDSEAKRRGYSGLQELLENDPSAQTKMAAQWRAYHPRDEQGLLLQNDASKGINSALYGDQKSDTSRPIAGARDALGNAASFVASNAPASEDGPWTRSKEQSAVEQNNALVQWAKSNGVAIEKLPDQFTPRADDDVGGSEHHVWPTENGRWLKSTRGGATGTGMGSIPIVRPDGSWELHSATPSEYLQSRDLENKVFGDDIRLHAIQVNGNNVNVVTSQPHVSGQKPTQPQIDSAMTDAGFARMDDATYYRKSDNVAVFDLHPNNAFIHQGALLPIDAIVVHPSEELIDALKDSQMALLNRRPAPQYQGSFLNAARPQATSDAKAANFLPAEKYDPSLSNSPIIDEGQPAWINRFEQLYQKDAKGGLTPKEDDELDALHQRIDATYGSLNAYDRERQKQGLPRISMTTQDMAKRRLMAA